MDIEWQNILENAFRSDKDKEEALKVFQKLLNLLNKNDNCENKTFLKDIRNYLDSNKKLVVPIETEIPKEEIQNIFSFWTLFNKNK